MENRDLKELFEERKRYEKKHRILNRQRAKDILSLKSQLRSIKKKDIDRILPLIEKGDIQILDGKPNLHIDILDKVLIELLGDKRCKIGALYELTPEIKKTKKRIEKYLIQRALGVRRFLPWK